MKIFSIAATGMAYFCAGASFACNMPVVGLVWVVLGGINHFISLAW
jgi:hypothetical protein